MPLFAARSSAEDTGDRRVKAREKYGKRTEMHIEALIVCTEKVWELYGKGRVKIRKEERVKWV